MTVYVVNWWKDVIQSPLDKGVYVTQTPLTMNSLFDNVFFKTNILLATMFLAKWCPIGLLLPHCEYPSIKHACMLTHWNLAKSLHIISSRLDMHLLHLGRLIITKIKVWLIQGLAVSVYIFMGDCTHCRFMQKSLCINVPAQWNVMWCVPTKRCTIRLQLKWKHVLVSQSLETFLY